jgi:hypothetical protein
MAKVSDLDAIFRENPELVERLSKTVVPQVALQLLRDGDVSAEGKSSDQIKNDVASFLKEAIAKKKFRFSIGIDHASELLPEARRLLRAGKNELSAVYFATYFEHRFNWLIVQICDSKKIGGTIIKQVLRDTNLRAKCTWVMTLLGHKPFSKDKLKAIEDIAEVRNAFIHYKWPTSELYGQESMKSREQVLARLGKAEALVRYLRKFEDTQIYKGHGRRVKKALGTTGKKSRQPQSFER